MASQADSDVRGAIYVPARAYNAYQMWADYDESIVERDLGYADSVNLDALRAWLSYEYWLEAPDEHEAAFDHLLSAAADRGIRILPSLFESVGVEPTEANRTDRDPTTAYAVHSPSADVVSDSQRWDRPREFVRWFMDRWRDDQRLLAVEVHNEPGVHGDCDRLRFARAMFETMAAERGDRPLTVGATSVENNMYFLDMGLDVLQFHRNFPPSVEDARGTLADAELASAVLDRPVWLTEWQRVRPSGSGWNEDDELPEDERGPDLASMSDTVRAADIDGDFFWSLMVKPAWLVPQREKGTINGLFHEDGTVWSEADARAVAGDETLEFEERQEWPEWAEPFPEDR